MLIQIGKSKYVNSNAVALIEDLENGFVRITSLTGVEHFITKDEFVIFKAGLKTREASNDS